MRTSQQSLAADKTEDKASAAVAARGSAITLQTDSTAAALSNTAARLNR